jgi:hypothetical protein
VWSSYYSCLQNTIVFSNQIPRMIKCCDMCIWLFNCDRGSKSISNTVLWYEHWFCQLWQQTSDHSNVCICGGTSDLGPSEEELHTFCNIILQQQTVLAHPQKECQSTPSKSGKLQHRHSLIMSVGPQPGHDKIRAPYQTNLCVMR